MTWCREVARVSCLRCGLHLQSACSGWIAFSPLPVTMLVTSSLVSRMVDCFISFLSLPVYTRACGFACVFDEICIGVRLHDVFCLALALGIRRARSLGSWLCRLSSLGGVGPWRSSRAAWCASGRLVLMSNPGVCSLCSIACACACCFL